MFKKKLMSIFLQLTEPIVKKNLAIKHHFLNEEKSMLLKKFFPSDKTDIVFETKHKIKINLNKNSKLSEFILIQNFEESELTFIHQYLKEGDIVFEIGANIGLHALHEAHAVGSSGKVHAFEPVPNTYKYMEKNIQLNHFSNIRTYNVGLSNIASNMEINLSVNYDAWNTLVDKERLPNQGDLYDSKVEVSLIRMDDFIADNNIEKEKIALVKIDVEGWEKFVLNGGAVFLQSQSPLLMVEFDETNTWAAGYTGQELYDILSNYGYLIYKLVDGKLVKEPKQLHYPSQNLFAIKEVNSLFLKRLKF